MSRAEGELPEFRIGRIMLTATELAGLAECEAAARCGGTLGVEDSQEMEDPPNSPTIFYVGKKPPRYRFVLRHNSKPDPGTGLITLTREPHRHTRGDRHVARARREALRVTFVPVWRLRAPEISDWDRSEFEPPPTYPTYEVGT